MVIVPSFSAVADDDRDWLRVGLQEDRISSPGWIKNFLISAESSPELRATQPYSHCLRPDGEGHRSPPTNAYVKKKGM
jgi:hypothetical protein